MGKHIRKMIPSFAYNILWGARERFGLIVKENDPCWIQWKDTYNKFYLANQRNGIGKIVNEAGYKIMQDIDLTDKKILEIGAGDIRHLKYLCGKPKEYLLADISTSMMDLAKQKLKERNIFHRSILINRNQTLPLEDQSIDVIVSFYSLEHLYPLSDYLKDILRVLKPGGFLIGAIPAEGGLAWGLGRMLTSRRWFKKNTNINPDKIICWEHPNFADQIILQLDACLAKQKLSFWPLSIIPSIDTNLIIKFVYKKSN